MAQQQYQSVKQSTNDFACGTLTATTSAVSITAGVSTPCTRVKLMAPTASTPGGATNSADILFGTATVLNDRISSDGTRDTYVHVADASTIYFKGGSTNDHVEYRIEK